MRNNFEYKHIQGEILKAKHKLNECTKWMEIFRDMLDLDKKTAAEEMVESINASLKSSNAIEARAYQAKL